MIEYDRLRFQLKNNKLDIIIEYLKKNNLENNYLRKQIISIKK